MPVCAAAASATTTSPVWRRPKPPHVPTRMKVVTPSISSSSTTIEVVGVPMAVD